MLCTTVAVYLRRHSAVDTLLFSSSDPVWGDRLAVLSDTAIRFIRSRADEVNSSTSPNEDLVFSVVGEDASPTVTAVRRAGHEAFEFFETLRT